MGGFGPSEGTTTAAMKMIAIIRLPVRCIGIHLLTGEIIVAKSYRYVPVLLPHNSDQARHTRCNKVTI
jgi:hypothetical protein